MSLITLLFFIKTVDFMSSKTECEKQLLSFYFIPSSWQFSTETIYDIVSQLLFDNINVQGEKYFRTFLRYFYLFF